MTVRFPLRISTTCDALLVSFASLPATKNPQNADAAEGASTPAARKTTKPPLNIRKRAMSPPGPGTDVPAGERILRAIVNLRGAPDQDAQPPNASRRRL